MAKKIIILCLIGIALLSSAHSFASSVEATIQFKNEDSKESAPIVLTMKPYLDNFSWADLTSRYKAIWNFPTQTKSFKDVDKLMLAPQESVSANLSYPWNDNWYGMSQYAFNYADRSKEYGCFVTELRLSGRVWEKHNYNVVIASYRKDPTHSDDYLTCYAEKNTASSFTVRMGSSKNKKEEKNVVDDGQRYSRAGDVEKLRLLDYYNIDRPIELWKDQATNSAFVLANNKDVPVITPIQPFNVIPQDTLTIKLISNTAQTLIAGQSLLDKWSRLNSNYYILQPENIQSASKESVIKFRGNDFSLARLHYHFADYAEDSGCYITAFTNDIHQYNANEIIALYHLDSKHKPQERKLYCFISQDTSNGLLNITITFYDNPFAIKEKINVADLVNTISSSFLNRWHETAYGRAQTYYSNPGNLNFWEGAMFEPKEVDFNLDPTRHLLFNSHLLFF